MTKPLDILFTTADLGGNVSPVMPIVRQLTARGHRIRIMSDASIRDEAEAAGADFVGWTRAPNKPARVREAELPDWNVSTEEGIGMVVGFLGATAHDYACDTMAELERRPADLVVCFDMLLGPMLGCEALGQPLALLGTMLSFFPLAGGPPLGSGLGEARDAAERAEHERRSRAMEAIHDSALPALNAARSRLGLPPLAHLKDQWNAAAVHWLGTAQAFDYPEIQLRPNMRYAGPLVGDPVWAEPWRAPWPADDQRPLVLVGFSTSFQDHAGVLQRVIDAAAPLPVRVLVTLGGSIEPSEVVPAANTVIVRSAPHTDVMLAAKLVVTHGGHGTVMAALMHRLPMLVLPHGRDQGDNGARIVDRGAGLMLPKTSGVEAIRSALARLVDDAAFTDAARRLGDAVAAEAAASTLVADLEQLAATSAAPAARVPA